MIAHRATHSEACKRLESRRRLELQPPLTGRAHDRVGQRMFAALVEAGGQAQHLVNGKSRCRDHLFEHRPSLGQGAGLVHDQGIDAAQVLDRRRVAKQHAALRAEPGRHHDRHRRRQSERAGAGDDQYRHGADQPVHPARFGAEHAPGKKAQQRDRHHREHEVARHHIRHALHRRPRALRLRHHLHDLRQHGGGPDPLGTHQQCAAGIERGSDQPIARLLGDRHRFAGEHRLVDRAAALDHHAIGRYLLAGAHPQRVADMHMCERHVLFATVGIQAARGFWCQAEQRADRRRGLRACLQLQHLPEQCQRDDHGRGLEIHRDPPLRHERGGKHLGRQGRDHAVAERGSGAEPDQRPHVRTAVGERIPAAHEKRPSRPQRNRQRQHQLDAALQRHVEPLQAMPEHGEHKYTQAQWQGPPEAAPEIAQLRVFFVLQARHLGLQRHATLRAVAGAGLADFRMHRAGVDRTLHRLFGCPPRGITGGVQKPVRLGSETRLATRAAKIEHRVLMAVAVLRLRAHAHAAYRVFQRCCARSLIVVMRMIHFVLL